MKDEAKEHANSALLTWRTCDGLRVFPVYFLKFGDELLNSGLRHISSRAFSVHFLKRRTHRYKGLFLPHFGLLVIL